MPKNIRKPKIDNDAWITAHFQEIVDKYGGKYPYILVSAGKVFPIKLGDDIAKIEAEITRQYGKPIGMPVPTKEELMSHILIL